MVRAGRAGAPRPTRRACRSSRRVWLTRIHFCAARPPKGSGRLGDTSEISALEIGAGNDSSEMVRAAMAFALQKNGRNYMPRLVESLDSEKAAPQIAELLIELGPSIAPQLHTASPGSQPRDPRQRRDGARRARRGGCRRRCSR